MMGNQYAIERFRSGKVGKGSTMRSSGDKLYSYGTVILQRSKGGELIGNTTKYSPTTSRHQSLAGVREANTWVNGIPVGTMDLAEYVGGDGR